jgi:hypothetical protein
MTATLTLYHHSTSVCSAKVRVALGETYRTPTLETLAICCAALDRLEEARSFVGQIRQLEKPPDTLAQMKARRPDWAAEMASMLRKAGLPE